MGTDSRGIRTSDERGRTGRYHEMDGPGSRWEKGRMVMDKNSTGIKKKIAMAAVLVGAQHSDFLIHP